MLLVPGISQPPSGSPFPLEEKSLRVQVIPLERPALPAKGIQHKEGFWSLGCSHKPSLPSLTGQLMILMGVFQHSIFCSSVKLKTSYIQRLRKPECQALSDLVSQPLRIWQSCSRVRLLSLPKHLTPECDQHLWRLQVIAKQTLCATTFATLLLQYYQLH